MTNHFERGEIRPDYEDLSKYKVYLGDEQDSYYTCKDLQSAIDLSKKLVNGIKEDNVGKRKSALIELFKEWQRSGIEITFNEKALEGLTEVIVKHISDEMLKGVELFVSTLASSSSLTITPRKENEESKPSTPSLRR